MPAPVVPRTIGAAGVAAPIDPVALAPLHKIICLTKIESATKCGKMITMENYLQASNDAVEFIFTKVSVRIAHRSW